MAKYIDADLLRKEIEKRLKNVRDYMSGTGMRYKGPKYFKAQGKESAYDALLSIVNSLQQEQPEIDSEKPIPNDLVEAAETEEDRVIEEVEKDDRGCPYISSTHVYNAFVHGAKWQKEQDEKEQADLFTIVALDAAQRAKEQMMKAAVEGEVVLNPYPTICLDDCKDYDFNDGDKVRIIIVKE